MKFGTKTRYGMRALVEIAMADQQKGILQKEIAKRQFISVKYLDRIIYLLKEAGLIKNIKGKKSGYRLTKDPKDISALEIHLAFEPEIAVIECLSNGFDCDLMDTCHTNPFWDGLNQTIVNYFSKATLDDLIHKHNFTGL